LDNSGYIKKRIEDSDFLIENGKYESALLLLLTAVDASAIKVFPKGMLSLYKKNTGKIGEMGNAERYKRFLGVRVQEILGVVLSSNAYYEDVFKFTDGDSPQDIIYKALRCSDVHEGHIPYEYRYIYTDSSTTGEISVSFSGPDVIFDRGFLTLIRRAVVEAPCNDKEFGRESYSISYGGFDNDIDYAHSNKDRFKLSPGRIAILVKKSVAYKKNNPQLSDEELKKLIAAEIKDNSHGSYNFSGYSDGESYQQTEGIRSMSGEFTDTGRRALDFIFNDIEFSKTAR